MMKTRCRFPSFIEDNESYVDSDTERKSFALRPPDRIEYVELLSFCPLYFSMLCCGIVPGDVTWVSFPKKHRRSALAHFAHHQRSLIVIFKCQWIINSTAKRILLFKIKMLSACVDSD